MIDAPYAKYISSENIYILKLYCQRQSTSSQIFVEIKVIQGVVFPEISNLNDSAPDKKPKYSRKRKISLILSNIFATHQLMDRAIEYSIHQFCKTFSHLALCYSLLYDCHL